MTTSLVRTAVVDEVTGWWNRNHNSVCVVTGAFGTGKSHVLASLVERDTDWWPWLSDDVDESPVIFGSVRSRDGAHPMAGRSIDDWLSDLEAQYVSVAPDARATVLDSIRTDADNGASARDVDITDFELSPTPPNRWNRFHIPVLTAIGRERPVLLVIDALDERDRDFRRWIVAWLGRLPDGVRAVVSSRPALELGALRTTVIDLDTGDLDTAGDMREYCIARLAGSGELDDETCEVSAETIVAKSEGKFLYCRYVCDEINNPANEIRDPASWAPPAGMKALYDEFTARFEARVADAAIDRDLGRAVLASIAVAQGNGIGVTTLTMVHATDRATVRAIIEAAGHYLSSNVRDDADTALFRVSHFSLAEHWLDLTDPNRLSHPADAHRRLADGLIRHLGPNADPYAIANVVRHYCEARDRWTDEAESDEVTAVAISGLVTGWDWLEARIIHDRNAFGTIGDLDAAIEACVNDHAPPVGESGFRPRTLHRALRLIGPLLGDVPADQPQRVAQQLQHHAVRTDDRTAAAATRARLDELRKPCAVLSWSTQQLRPALRQVLHGHVDPVNSVAWSPDGRQLATCSSDATIRIWDVAAGAQSAILNGHSDKVTSVAWSPDGEELASASDDATMCIWNVVTGRATATRTGHAGSVLSVAWSPDGAQLATAGADATVRIWDATTALTTAVLTGHQQPVRSVAWSPDGAQLATAGADATVRIWDATTALTTTVLTGHRRPVGSVVWSPDGRQIATAGDERRILVWDVTTAKPFVYLAGHDDWVRSVAWSPDGQQIVSASEDSTVRVWNSEGGIASILLTGHSGSVRSVAWSPDGRHVASVGWDEFVRVWDVTSDYAVSAIDGHTNKVTSVAWSPDGQRLATASFDKTARIWDTATATTTTTLTGHSDVVNAVTWSPDGSHVATASNDNRACVWDFAAGATTTLDEHREQVLAVAWSPNGRKLATASNDDTARTWEVSSGLSLSTLTGHAGDVNDVRWSPDGHRLATAGDDHAVVVWDVASNREISTLSGHGGEVTSLAWSPNGMRLASTSRDKTLRVWDVATVKNIRTFTDHTASVWSVTWSPDGRFLATSAGDRTVRIWHPEAGGCLLSAVLTEWPFEVDWFASQVAVADGNDASVFELLYLDGGV